MKKLSLYELQVKGRKVLVRVDYNVPISADGKILDPSRIDASLLTIKYILSQGGSVILLSHLGRPKGCITPSLSLRPCFEYLATRLDAPVYFSEEAIGPHAAAACQNLQFGEVLLLENLRFYPEEEQPDKDNSFAKILASYGDCYVNEAFSVSHRAHSSVCGLPKLFPELAASGFLLDKEVSFLSQIALKPKRPFFAVIGGAKISTKIGVLQSLLNKIDSIFIGGAMAYTFLKATGYKIGNSVCDDEYLSTATRFLESCNAKAIRCFLPKDIVISPTTATDSQYQTIATKDGIPDGWFGVDIGQKTIDEWRSSLEKAATIFWNGPLGITELSKFSYGTEQIALGISQLHATTIIGGGDSAAAIQKLGINKNFTHISTGGGASLEFIEFGHLPGIDALSNT